MQLKRKALALVFALVAMVASASAHASIPRVELLETTAQIDLLHAPAIDLAHETTAQERVQSLSFFSGSSFEGLALIEVPAPSIAAELESELTRKLAAGQAATCAELRVFEEAAKEKLASGVFAYGAENNFKLFSELSGKWHRGTVIQALPFSEPVTGLVYARNRWYDPSTGTFLSPDPLGYQDSSNLYSFAGGDPVNRRDPTGELSDDYVLNTVIQRKQEADRRAAEAWCRANPVECKKAEIRVAGFLRAGGGALQAGVGGAALAAPEPTMVTKAVGVVAVVRGVDNTVAGVMEVVTGERHDTVTARATYLVLVKAGVDAKKASAITGWTEVAVDVASSIGSGIAAKGRTLPPPVSRSDPATFYAYRELREMIKAAGLSGRSEGLEAHHLLERRFAQVVGVAEDDVISVALTPAWHRNVGGMGTNLNAMVNREFARLGATPATATVQQVWQAHKAVYLRVGQQEWADALYRAHFAKLGVAY